MSIHYACVLPHPPLILPEIGRGEEHKINHTIQAYRTIAENIARIQPETIVLVTPHAPMYRDGFFLAQGQYDTGDMGRFNTAQLSYTYPIDEAFVDKLIRLNTDIKASALELDHGAIVPLAMIKDYYSNFKLVRIGISGLNREHHRALGKTIHAIATQLNRKTVFIASGDLSHRLKIDGPYGFNPDGPRFDHKVKQILTSGHLEDLFELPSNQCHEAGECGYRSLLVLAGVLDSLEIKSEVLSYEAPFGVGYLCASIHVLDPLVVLARKAIEHYVKEKSIIDVSLVKSNDSHRQAACFVSLHKGEQLRGCIGTLQATQSSLLHEIIHNAISACSKDPRFNPVEAEELDDLDISVDVLNPAEPVSKSQLDPKRYGVIVRSAWRTGVLLPDLEGVDTIDKQLNIALCKAGIDPNDDYSIERFEVTRHHAYL
jgi:AmmeMemoRadiSam system protein A/AmmeMemoRadiSam system protein B